MAWRPPPRLCVRPPRARSAGRRLAPRTEAAPRSRTRRRRPATAASSGDALRARLDARAAATPRTAIEDRLDGHVVLGAGGARERERGSASHRLLRLLGARARADRPRASASPSASGQSYRTSLMGFAQEDPPPPPQRSRGAPARLGGVDPPARAPRARRAGGGRRFTATCCLPSLPIETAPRALASLLPLVPLHAGFGRHLLLLLRKNLVAPEKPRAGSPSTASARSSPPTCSPTTPTARRTSLLPTPRGARPTLPGAHLPLRFPAADRPRRAVGTQRDGDFAARRSRSPSPRGPAAPVAAASGAAAAGPAQPRRLIARPSADGDAIDAPTTTAAAAAPRSATRWPLDAPVLGAPSAALCGDERAQARRRARRRPTAARARPASSPPRRAARRGRRAAAPLGRSAPPAAPRGMPPDLPRARNASAAAAARRASGRGRGGSASAAAAAALRRGAAAPAPRRGSPTRARPPAALRMTRRRPADDAVAPASTRLTRPRAAMARSPCASADLGCGTDARRPPSRSPPTARSPSAPRSRSAAALTISSAVDAAAKRARRRRRRRASLAAPSSRGAPQPDRPPRRAAAPANAAAAPVPRHSRRACRREKPRQCGGARRHRPSCGRCPGTYGRRRRARRGAMPTSSPRRCVARARDAGASGALLAHARPRGRPDTRHSAAASHVPVGARCDLAARRRGRRGLGVVVVGERGAQN